MQMPAPSVVYGLPLFAGLSEDIRDSLLQSGRLRRCASGQNLFVYGDNASSFFIICDGTIRLFRETPNGREMTSDVLLAGDTIGDAEILQSRSVYQFNAFAVKDTVVMEFPAAWLKESAKKHTAFSLNLLSKLAQRAHMVSVETEHKSTMSAAQQVICFLERLCVLHDFDPAGFELPYSKTLIASRLGMELETFSRALSKVREHGIVIKGTSVSFHDIDKVEEFVCGDCSIAGNCQEHEAIRAQLHQNKSSDVA